MKHTSKAEQHSPDILLDIIISHLKEHHDFSAEEIQHFLLQKEEPTIPLSIFSEKLSSFEAVVKYLIENRNMKVKEIAKELNRKPPTIYTTYQHARKKHSAHFSTLAPLPSFPLSLLKDREKPVLEAIVVYLKEEQQMSFIDISRHLCRSHSTIWITYRRSRKKGNVQGKKLAHGKTKST